MNERQQQQQDLIEGLVNRFLRWKLPNDFKPDRGINFTPAREWPTGTCLLTAEQARAMFEYCLRDTDAVPDGYWDQLENKLFGTTESKKVTRYLWACNGGDGWLQSSTFRTEQEAKAFFDCEIKRLDWSATDFEG